MAKKKGEPKSRNVLGFRSTVAQIGSPVKVRVAMEIMVGCCPKCGGSISVKQGDEGVFAVCDKDPKECEWSAPIVEE